MLVPGEVNVYENKIKFCYKPLDRYLIVFFDGISAMLFIVDLLFIVALVFIVTLLSSQRTVVQTNRTILLRSGSQVSGDKVLEEHLECMHTKLP